MVQSAIAEAHRDASDIYLVECPWCSWISYYNEGSHASCRNRNCGRDLTAQTDEAFTLAEYWCYAPYPCDEAEGVANKRTTRPKGSGSPNSNKEKTVDA